MIEKLDGMPAGTIGFRATGKLTADDYREHLVPAIKAAVAAGDVRMLYALGPGFDGAQAGAMVEDTKVGFRALAHHSAWTRCAIATDKDWIRDGMHLFGWMVPGEVKIFELDDLEAAKSWLAAD